MVCIINSGCRGHLGEMCFSKWSLLILSNKVCSRSSVMTNRYFTSNGWNGVNTWDGLVISFLWQKLSSGLFGVPRLGELTRQFFGKVNEVVPWFVALEAFYGSTKDLTGPRFWSLLLLSCRKWLLGVVGVIISGFNCGQVYLYRFLLNSILFGRAEGFKASV